jgi:hypothetical protein
MAAYAVIGCVKETIHDQYIKACPYCRAGGDERRIAGIRPIVQ